VTGSITRIKLMILGPNGTCKSTIAAGIAIGLGFKPEVCLQRGDYAETTDHGSSY
jgi:predicted ATPase